ncbi:hypothetical protein Ahy_A05g025833 [Arachis hypogaea]|uniref:MULE transposase domain-containing protein n=1 Tax=Arachis hypogaea TaxID=3818 RepID=A0A445D9K8_ARAHY|nr:hypothetical protein Ahy_A05g025833 [Arachis hypogaea]
MYIIESRAQISFIELYIEFEQSEADQNILREDYNSESEEEFESNYEIVGPDGDEEQGDDTVAPNVTDVANALANDVPFEKPSFMRVLNLKAMHAPEFPGYISAEAIKSLVETDPLLKVKSVIAEVQSKFNYTVSYRKAWLAKKNSVEKIFGGWEASYEALPIWFEAMCHKEPSAVSYYPCIRAFRHCKPVVQVNGTHLYRKYKGCLLVAVSQDGNNNIVPIAFAIVEVTRDGVGLISDRHESINAAVERSNGAWSPPRAFHMFCIRHIESNFFRKFKASYLQKLVVNIGYSRMVHEYEVRYQRLREWGEAYTNWLDRIPREQYALAFDGGYRWGHMTTNLVECINSVLKGARNLSITALVKATFYRLNELFTQKRAEAEARINAGHVFF